MYLEKLDQRKYERYEHKQRVNGQLDRDLSTLLYNKHAVKIHVDSGNHPLLKNGIKMAFLKRGSWKMARPLI